MELSREVYRESFKCTGTSLIVKRCGFIGCRATDGGGGLCCRNQNLKASIELSIFEDCSSKKGGGGFYFHGSSVSVRRCCVTKCRTDDTGMALAVEMTNGVNAFDNLAAKHNCAPLDSFGSQLLRLNKAITELTLCNLSCNAVSRTGGAFHCTGNVVTVNETNFHNLTAEGAVFEYMSIEGCVAMFRSCNIVCCTSRNRAIITQAVQTEFRDCVIIHNSRPFAIYIPWVHLQISVHDSIFDEDVKNIDFIVLDGCKMPQYQQSTLILRLRGSDVCSLGSIQLSPQYLLPVVIFVLFIIANVIYMNPRICCSICSSICGSNDPKRKVRMSKTRFVRLRANTTTLAQENPQSLADDVGIGEETHPVSQSEE